MVAGCRSVAAPPLPLSRFFGDRDTAEASTAQSGDAVGRVAENGANASAGSTQPEVALVSAEESIVQRSTHSAKQAIRLISGKEIENQNEAKRLYQQADQVFRSATGQSEVQRKKTFARSAKMFGKSAEASEGTALEQDALYMQAESLFFSDQLPAATEAYQKLQAEHPRNRHNDQVASRLFAISRYWIQANKAGDDAWYKLNLTDASRPRLDADGHAIRVLDQIRYDDPTGRLADDATMAAAAEFIRQKKFEEADEFLTDLRETFSDSEHMFLAHLLGIRCKLEMYRGPRYSGLVLEEAQELIDRARTRFPDKLRDEKYADMVARAAAEVGFKRSERLMYRAEYREKRKEYGAARYYYQRILDEFSDTPQADQARERLGSVEQLPAVPEQRLSWLTTIFPESRAAQPLKLESGADVDPGSAEPTPGGTILR